MSAKIGSLPNSENAAVILDFYEYMKDRGSSENHIINNIKVILDLAGFLGPLGYRNIEKKEQILSFLNLKIKDPKIDSEKRWITTWNHYLNRTKLFYRCFTMPTDCRSKRDIENYMINWSELDYSRICQDQTKAYQAA
jgi:hypothetical protein